jgi:hypothetical protein
MARARQYPFTVESSHNCQVGRHWACHGRYGQGGRRGLRACRCLCHQPKLTPPA